MKSQVQSKGPQPEQFAKCGTEDGHQTALFLWASQNREQWPELALMYAIPNGGYRDKITAGKLKAQGVRSGVPDICLPIPRGSFHSLYIEMKRPMSEGKAKGYLSPEQKKWKEELQKQGHGVVVAIGWEQAKDLIIQYLNWRQ